MSKVQPTEFPRPADKSNPDEPYFIAGGVLLGLIIIAILLIVWFLYKRRKKERAKSDALKNEYKVLPKAPEIKVNAIKFTVPQLQKKHKSWSVEKQDSIGSKESRDKYAKHIANEGLGYSATPPPVPTTYPSTTQHIHKAFSAESLTSSAESAGYKGLQTDIGLLRPDLYVSDSETDQQDEIYPAGHIGRLWFRVEYDVETENLVVTLIKVRHLPGRQARSSISMSPISSCDPFVRIYLLPDEKRYLQSKMKKRTRNPTFNQTFAFTMSYGLLRNRTLRFSVYDVDRFMRQVAIGHVLFPLEKLDITTPTEEWADLERKSQPPTNSIGEILVTLTHFPAMQRLAITVVKATNLRLPEVTALDPYVKVSFSVLGKVLRTKKTLVQKGTCDPAFNHCFEFKLDSSDLDRACLTVEVLHSTPQMVKMDRQIGRITIGGAMVSRGKELEHWSKMLAKPQTPIKEWHDLKN